MIDLAQRSESYEITLPYGLILIGIDMNAALGLATARRCDLAVLSELLPVAEAGLVKTVSADRGRSDGP
jgi:hypothetical protein